GFALDIEASNWPPLTLRLDAAPLEVALPKLVGDLEYAAEWKTVNGTHRLTKLRVGALRQLATAVDASSDEVLPPGEVTAALDRAIAEMHDASRPGANAPEQTKVAPKIDDPDPDARIRAVLALTPEGEQLETLQHLLKSDPDPRVRAAATASLENSE